LIAHHGDAEGQEGLIKELLKNYYSDKKDKETIEKLLANDLKLSWKKIGSHSLHIISRKLGTDFI